MTAGSQERAAGIDQLCRAGGAGRDPQNTIGWRAWVAWCGTNGLAEHPPAAQQPRALMLFLLHNHDERGWRRDTCAQYAREIARVWSSTSDARTLDTTALLSWMGKQVQPNAPQVGSFEVEQVLAVGAALQVIPTLPASRQPSDPEVALAALVALADIADVSPFQRRRVGVRDLSDTVWGQPDSVFAEQRGRIVFTHAGTRLVIRRDLHPEHFHAVSTALARAAQIPGDGPPLVRLWPRLLRSSGTAHKAMLLSAWVRATAGRGGQDQRRYNNAANRHACQDWWDEASPGDRAWLVRVAGDQDLVRRCSDLAYFYTGITTALRHATLRELLLDEVEVRADGLVLSVPPTKHKSGNADLGKGKPGEWLRKAVPHMGTDGAGCPAHCPACALLAHLEIRRRHGASGRDLVFPPLHADASRYTTAAGTRALRRVWALAEDYLDAPQREVEARIGTRSLRVSAATLARLGKLPLSTIQRLLDHRDPGVTELYIRIHDPYAEDDLVLTVRPPISLTPAAEDSC